MTEEASEEIGHVAAIRLSVSDRTCCAWHVTFAFLFPKDHSAVVAQASCRWGHRTSCPVFQTPQATYPLAEDSAGETPAVPADKMSGLPLQLRAEGVSQPFHSSLPQRATPELLKGVLAALAEIAGKGFLHVSPKIEIVHYHIQFFVNFRRTRVEV